MPTTLTIDDELFSRALALSEPRIEKAELLKECVKAYIQRQTARRLAALGGHVERHHLQGCGFVDLSLLASVLLQGRTLLWTLDKRLEAMAIELKHCYQPIPS
jgi:hypothetical protein